MVINNIAENKIQTIIDEFPNHHVDIFRSFGTTYCRFNIPVRVDSAYMKQELSSDSDSYIVMVERERFLLSWKNQKHQEPHLCQGDEQVWRADYKFHFAQDGFDKGSNNPVPLSEPCCTVYLDKGLPTSRIGFTNGITRTIWLLANDAMYFPVVVSNEYQARVMHRFIGTRNFCPVAISGLFEKYVH